MSTPVRRRPGASPIQMLTPHIEEVRTSRVDDEPAPGLMTAPPTLTTEAEPEASAPAVADDTPVPAATVNAPAAPAATPTPASSAAPAPTFTESDEKKATTLAIRRSIKARAETAVLRTAGFDGGYKSWASFVEGALERELQRLEQEFNGGESFPPNMGSFRQGRPLGS